MKARLLLLSIIAILCAHVLEASTFRLCGFGPSPGNEDSLCGPIEAECPTQYNRKRFCLTTVDTELGFLLGCAPVNQTKMCSPGSCEGSGRDYHNPKFNSDICDAIDWSVLVYDEPHTIQKTLADLGIHDVRVGQTEVGDVQFFHYTTKDKQWLVFRGTDPKFFCNVLTDTEYQLVPSGISPNLRLHHGFFAAAKSALKGFRVDPSKRLIIAGHSLGGAVATVAGLLLQDQGYLIDSVLTFGQPQVTDQKSIFESEAIFEVLPLLRVINADDPIPYLFWLIPAEKRNTDPYRQFGPELRIGINEMDTSQFAYLTWPTGIPKGHAQNHSACEYQKHVAAVASCTPRIFCRP